MRQGKTRGYAEPAPNILMYVQCIDVQSINNGHLHRAIGRLKLEFDRTTWRPWESLAVPRREIECVGLLKLLRAVPLSFDRPRLCNNPICLHIQQLENLDTGI